MRDERVEYQRLMKRNEYDLPEECGNCGSTTDLHVHHIVPLALGGTNRRTNLCVLCGICHGKIHGLDFDGHVKAIISGMKRVRAQGGWSNGTIPYGYAAGRKRGEIVINEEEAQIVRLLYKWRYKDELPFSAIVTYLTRMAICGRKEGAKWSKSTLRQILTSKAVFGGNHFNVNFPSIIDEEYRELITQFNAKYDEDKYALRSKGRLQYAI